MRMRDALLIFRKDVRHLWPRILIVLAIAALEGLLNAAAPAGNPLQLSVVWLWGFSCVYLTASAIQEESLPGDNQYWLTRPFSRRGLLMAKVLLLAVFASAPRMVVQAVALRLNGVSPLRYASVLFATGVFSLAIGLAAAALAAVTENLMQFLWVLLPIAAVEILSLMYGGREIGQNNVAWIRSSALGALIVAASIAILIVQYSRRKTFVSAGILAGTLAMAAMVPLLVTWHAAFALQSKLGRAIGPASMRISFEPSGPAGNYTAEYGKALEGIDLPIRITGIPAGTRAVSERVATTIEAPGGKTWSSGWTSTGAIANPNPLEDSHAIRADGAYRQHLYVDAEFYRAVKDAPVHLHASVAVTLLGERQSAPISARGRTGHLPGDGICGAGPGPFPSNVVVFCDWPGQAPARVYVQARSLKNGQTLESLLLPAGPYAPYPTDGSMWSGAETMFTAPPEPVEMKLETWRAIGHFERELDIPQIRLSDYAVRRITDPN